MAAKKTYLWLGGSERVNPLNSNVQFELDEAGIVWGTNDDQAPPSETKKVSRSYKKPIRKSGHIDQRPVSAASLPVNIPDWSKILGNEYKDRRVKNDEDNDDDDEEGDRDGRIPPHVYLARTRVASFSVHEGIGRTLKGRDLSRVRNAIWKQTGFED